MTFHQWAARQALESYERGAFQEIWNALIGGGQSPNQCASLLDDLCDTTTRRARDLAEDMADDDF